MGKKEKGLWTDILTSKYGSWRCLDFNNNKSRESRWWMDLRSICEKGEKGQWFNERLR